MKQFLHQLNSWWFTTMVPVKTPLTTIESREKQRKRRLFSVISLIVFLQLFIFLIQGFIIHAAAIQQSLSFFTCCIVLMTLFINQRGYLTSASAIFFSSILLTTTTLIHGLSAVFPILGLCLWASLPLLPVMAGLLLPSWGPLLLGITEVVFMHWFVFVDRQSYLANLLKTVNGPQEFFSYACAVIIGGALTGATYAITSKKAIIQADRAVELEQAHQDLSKTYIQLEVAHSTIKKQALIDELTNLPNHRAVMNQLTRELDQAQRYNRPFSLLFFDADRFKQVNDTYGHATGDVVLHQIGQRAASALRSGDTLGRFGGEEFVVLLPETSAYQARDVAERIRAAIASEPMATTEVTGGIAMTASIGLSTYQLHGNSAQELLSCADEAMYKAKHNGRNQVRTTEETRQAELI